MENKVEEERSSSDRSSLSFDGFDASESSSLDVDLVELESDTSSEHEEESTSSDEEDAKHADEQAHTGREQRKPPPLQLPQLTDCIKKSAETSRGLCEEELPTSRRKPIPPARLPPTQPEQEPSVHDEHSHTIQYSIDLLAPAFDVSVSVCDGDRTKEFSTIESIRRECAVKFGIREDRVKIFELSPSNNTANGSSSRKIGVEIIGSDFSVSRMEEILREREQRRLLVTSDSERLHILEEEVKTLKEKLTHSETLRYKAQKALGELRQEVDLLEKCLTRP